MTGYRGPIPPPEPPEFDPVRVSRIEKDKKVKQGYPEKEWGEDEKNTSILAYKFFSLIQKNLNALLPKKKGKGIPDTSDLAKNLQNVKDHFNLLKTQDESANSHFAEQLTVCWNELLKDFDTLRVTKSPTSELRRAVKTLINEIDAYPPTEEHSLGFYLTHYAGEQWLPFPFMAILRRLHQNHLENQDSSDLSHLIERIDDALNILMPKFPIDE